jgi:Xaa-Pro aminopeptidase
MNFKKRRQKVFETLNNNEMALFFAGKPVRKSADADYPFEANRNYYYLTGINEPEGVLMLIKRENKNQETLYIRDINPDMEKWIGRFVQLKDAREISQVDMVNFVSNFKTQFQTYLSRSKIDALYLDLDRQQMDTRPFESELFFEEINKNYPALPIKNSYFEVARLRTIKDEDEIKLIKEAADITNQAIEYAISNMEPGDYEYEIQADFLYVLNKNNASEMFDTIMASGKNGPILHYVENNAQTHDNDLILFDLGAKKNHYGADISRTYPVNGKFTERQKELYNIVLKVQEKVTQAAKPGVTLQDLNQIVIDYYKEELPKVGLTQPVATYYYHSVSHFLGLDTHDIGQIIGEPLQENQVISNEPGLYVQDENIGIRIETDLLITKDGCIDLAPQIKKSVDDIEAFMNR